MDWTWALDDCAEETLVLGMRVGVHAALLWWAAGALWLCRRWGTRVAVFLPLVLALGLGGANEPLLASSLFVSWLAAEMLVPRLVKARWGRRPGTPAPAAAFAAAGALVCLGVAVLGPLGLLASALFGRLGQLALVFTLLAALLSALALRRRVISSPALRAATAVLLVLVWDGMHLTRGGWTILLLGLPMLYELSAAVPATVRNGGPAGRRRLAAAAVWALALGGLIAHSRFNLELSQRRSAEVIAACRRYETDHGELPRDLGDLVPTYLPRVPRANWSLLGDFYYRAGGSPSLSYFAPWPDARVYLFDEDEWRLSPAAGFPAWRAEPHGPQPSARRTACVSDAVKLSGLPVAPFPDLRPPKQRWWISSGGSGRVARCVEHPPRSPRG
jgi:hypothetical protein